MNIYDEIRAERAAQDKKWGGPDFDDRHNSHDWVAYIVKHLGKAVMWPWDSALFRQQMIRVAALAVATVEAVDRWEELNKNVPG